MVIHWGGTLEEDGKKHGQYQAERRGVSLNQIEQAIKSPDATVRQSSDCVRYFKQFDGRVLAVVAVSKNDDVYEMITCWWRDV